MRTLDIAPNIELEITQQLDPYTYHHLPNLDALDYSRLVPYHSKPQL